MNAMEVVNMLRLSVWLSVGPVARSVHSEHSASADEPGVSGLRRTLDETGPSGQGMATSLLPLERRMPLLLRRHQRRLRPR